jgi:DNA mismatch repair endonuclease MutH
MERSEALKKLAEITGESFNLHELATGFMIVPVLNGKQNKGWAGQVVERHLGLPINSAQSPNFGSWELKSIPIRVKNGIPHFKETMAITMIDPYQVERTPFEKSHLLQKLKRFLCVVRVVGSHVLEPSYIHSVHQIDLDDEAYEIVKNDYESIREQIANGGLQSLSGRMGQLIQPRTNGKGHGSISRAFYARTQFLQRVIKFEPS